MWRTILFSNQRNVNEFEARQYPFFNNWTPSRPGFARGVSYDAQNSSLITDQRTDEAGYDGLDSSRDTEKELSTMIGFYPEVLEKDYGRREYLGSHHEYAIHRITYVVDRTLNRSAEVCNVKAVSLVYLFAKLAIEFNSSFENDGEIADRRGVLDINGGWGKVLHCLCNSSNNGTLSRRANFSNDHHR